MEVDEEFDNIRSLVFAEPEFTPSNAATADFDARGSAAAPEVNPTFLAKEVPKGDQHYDQLVRELAFDKRARPKDRTKTEDEIALEQKEALEEAERARLRRMFGEESEDDDNRNSRRRKRPRRSAELEDELEYESPNVMGFGLGDDGDASGMTGEDEESEDDGFEEDDDIDEAEEWGGLEETSIDVNDVLPRQGHKKTNNSVNKELPFTFPCPPTHDEFLSVLDGIEDRHLGTVVQRIRALYHPSLDEDNPRKLQVGSCGCVCYDFLQFWKTGVP